MFRAGMPLKSLMKDELIDFIGVRAEKTRQLYELGIRGFSRLMGLEMRSMRCLFFGRGAPMAHY